MFTKETRRLTFSKLMRKPMEMLQIRVNELLGIASTETPLRYMIYSAHDDHISNLWEWLPITNIQADYFLYSSQIVFELLSDPECLNTVNTEACFRVNVRFDAIDAKFSWCEESA